MSSNFLAMPPQGKRTSPLYVPVQHTKSYRQRLLRMGRTGREVGLVFGDPLDGNPGAVKCLLWVISGP